MGWFSKPKKQDKTWTGLLIRAIDKVGGASSTTRRAVPKEVVKGFLAPTIYAMLSDGERQVQEEIQLLAMLSTSPVLRNLNAKEFGETIDEVVAHFGQIGGREDREKLTQLIKELPSSLRGSAFTYAVRMAYADQHQTPEEEQALKDLQEWMGIDAATADSSRATMRQLIVAPPTT